MSCKLLAVRSALFLPPWFEFRLVTELRMEDIWYPPLSDMTCSSLQGCLFGLAVLHHEALSSFTGVVDDSTSNFPFCEFSECSVSLVCPVS